MHQRTLELSEIDVFRKISRDDFLELLSASMSTKYSKGSIVFKLGDPARFIHIVKKGEVKLFMTTESGKEIIVAINEPGDLFGFGPLYGEYRKTASAAAVKDSILCNAPYRVFEGIVRRNPQFAMEIIGILGLRIRHFHIVMEDLVSRNVQSRLARALLELADRSSLSPLGRGRSALQESIILSHEELGNLVSASRQKITTALNTFERKGLLQKSRKQIMILDRKGLKAMIESEGSYPDCTSPRPAGRILGRSVT